MKCEAHITVPVGHKGLAMKAIEENSPLSPVVWHWSAIDGDEVLGKKVFGYVSATDENLARLQMEMWSMSNRLKRLDCTVLREKIELIVHDVRYETKGVDHAKN